MFVFMTCDMVLVHTGDHTSTCDKDQFKCSNGKCISANLRCNFFNDCEDYGSDEIGCKTGEVMKNHIYIVTHKLIQYYFITRGFSNN